MPKIVVHHLEKSRSHRLLWLLEELELDYTLKLHRRHPQTIRAPPELRQIHPLGKAPILDVDGVIVAESGAVLEHCIEELGGSGLRPEAGTEARRAYRYWMHYAEGSLMSPLLVRLIFDRLRAASVPFFIKPVVAGIVKKVESNYTKPELELHSGFIEQHLAEHPYFAGDTFSAADIQMSYPVEALAARGRNDIATPHTQAWLERIRERPAYRRATDKGGPNDLL